MNPRDGLTTDDAPPTVTAAAFAPGSIIAGRYRIDGRLGAGGGGTVWRCTDQKLDMVVALKIVSSDGDLERWRREVAMARRIADRNVCRVHDLGETTELRFVTMELVEGASLRSKIRPDLPAAEARSLFSQIVSGVTAIHAAGVVHRDLKPENIVVANDGRAVIVDFGLAREPRPPGEDSTHGPKAGEAPAHEGAITKVVRGPAPDPVTSPGTVTNVGTVVGTPRYMSPEQAAGEAVDARADVWALGLIAHELLTGVMPEPDAHGRRIDPAVDDKWSAGPAILRRCLALLPGERYADARALHAALVLKQRRWPWFVGAAGVAAAGAVVAGIALGGRSGHEPAPNAPRPVRYEMVQVTSTERWPEEAPISVAIAPDAKRFAYTTGGAKLYVRDVAGGTKVAWPIPKFVKPSTRLDKPPEPRDLVTVVVVGWFADRSLGLAGTTPDGDHHLYRVYQDGTFQLLYSNRERFIAAVTAVRDRIAIGIDGEALHVIEPGARGPVRIATIGRGERVMALAWSADGTKLACARLPATGDEAAIHVMQDTGKDVEEVWRGRLAIGEPLLAWVDARLAFTYQDPESHVTSLLAIDPQTKDVAVRESWTTDHFGMGTAANGTVLILRGTAAYSVQIRDQYGSKVVRAHADTVQGSGIAGWTTGGRLVFLEGPPTRAQIVVATAAEKPSQPWVTKPWPATTAGIDFPDTVVGDDLIAHRVDPEDATKVVVVRIAPTGERKLLLRIGNDAGVHPVRCAGDRAAPCVIEQLDGGHVTWTELDPETGAIGKLVHRRPVRDRFPTGVALSHDGAVLAVVDGSHQITLIDRATGELLPKPPAAEPGTALESVGFEASGSLWATAIGGGGRRFSLVRFHRRDQGYSRGSDLVMEDADVLRWFWRPTPVGEARELRLAVSVRDFHLEVWRATGI